MKRFGKVSNRKTTKTANLKKGLSTMEQNIEEYIDNNGVNTLTGKKIKIEGKLYEIKRAHRKREKIVITVVGCGFASKVIYSLVDKTHVYTAGNMISIEPIIKRLMVS